jgi:SAM-dependent methyltransferase
VRKQQQIWVNEHKKVESFKSYIQPEPSSMVVEFIKFLTERGVNLPLTAIDIGCGKGRNSIYLAQNGAQVHAIDYVQEALDFAQKRAHEAQVAHHIKFHNAAIDHPWPFEENFFDIAVDCFSSIDIETSQGREIYKKELLRTLKPDGFACVAVVAAHDYFEKREPSQGQPSLTIATTNHQPLYNSPHPY